MAQRARDGRPGDRAAGARVPGDRLRPRPDVLPRSREPAARGPRHDGVVLGPLRARPAGALEPGRLAAARPEPRRPAARGGAHRRARPAARRGRGLRRAARAGRRAASSTSASTARCTASSCWATSCRRSAARASTSSCEAIDRELAPRPSSTRSSSAPASPACTRCTACASARPQRARPRAGRRRRRHVVLEPLSRRPLRHRVDGLLLLVLEELEQEWEWSERYPAQPEILRYLNHVADRFDLRRDIELNTRVRRRDYDDERAGTSRPRTEPVSATYCIMASGCLSRRTAPRSRGSTTSRATGTTARGGRRRRRARRQARRRDRHRLDRHPADPAGRRAGRAPVRVPADAELQHARAQPAARARGPATRSRPTTASGGSRHASRSAACRARIPTCCRSARRSR